MNELKFCANLSMMFQEVPVLQRYESAKSFGFKGVELWFPYDIPLTEIAKKREETGMEQILINSYPGKATKLQKEQEKCLETLENNLRCILPKLEKSGIIGLIEPINNQTVTGYIMNDYDIAISMINSINSPNIRLMMDLFQIHGNLSKRIQKCLPFTGHIQIAQVPFRNEPDTPGEIDFNYVLNLFSQEKYNGWIGLEYKPIEETEKGLKWINKFSCVL